MTSLGEPSRQAVARAYRDAADVLDSGNFENMTCCGSPVDEKLGRCIFRPGHPTPTYVAILDYPEQYDEDGGWRG